jgi:hypothetical protein
MNDFIPIFGYSDNWPIMSLAFTGPVLYSKYNRNKSDPKWTGGSEVKQQKIQFSNSYRD